MLMNTMRANLLSGKFDDNFDPMSKFRDNCNTVVITYVAVFTDSWSCWASSCDSIGGRVCGSLGDICNSIPPLPIKLDTSLLPIAITGYQHDL